MAHHGPLVTAVVVVGGLIGLMTANAAGGLVTASDSAKDTPPATTTTTPPATTTAQTTTTTTEVPPAFAFPAEAVYAGRANGSPLAIAVAVKGAEASAYLCDGVSVESWLRGTAEGGRVDLASADGASRLTAELQGATLTGTVTLGGQQQSFGIAVAPPPAGLYRGEGGETTVGWIILPDGSQVGIAKSVAGRAPAPPLDHRLPVLAATVDGRQVAATKVAGDTTFG